MIKNGRFYAEITGETELGNEKYSTELKKCIEDAAKLCIENLDKSVYAPIMLLGNIQSGKTRAFIGLMALLYDNGFDMTIILTKCSKALVEQTVKRLSAEFSYIKYNENDSAGAVVAQNILDIESGKTVEEQNAAAEYFINRYKGKKRIIVVKKQAENVDRMNKLIEVIIRQDKYKRILIVDDEADITSIGYSKNREYGELSLRRISGAINTARERLHRNIEHSMLQVTATPYALYLQPEVFSNEFIMPVRPNGTVVMPTGEGYIGGQFYFLDSQDETSKNYSRARHVIHVVGQEEMGIINGSGKNSSKNAKIKDGRTIKMEQFISMDGEVDSDKFALPELRNWIFSVLVGAAIIQLDPEYNGMYVSAVMHAATIKDVHSNETDILTNGINAIRSALKENNNNADVHGFVAAAYDDLVRSVKAFGRLKAPGLNAVLKKIGSFNEDGELEGLITEVDIKRVNSDNDIMRLLNDDGELRLESAITIFVGGQVLDRGITIPNMINFFYGRDPKKMQQDTVMQHCRMYGYRSDVLLSVTRLYTTQRLFNSMREITMRDNILRERLLSQENHEVVYLESGGDIKPCSPAKVLASNIHSIVPERRYLPVGFDLYRNKREAYNVHERIKELLLKHNAIPPRKEQSYTKGDPIGDTYVTIDAEEAVELLRTAYEIIDPYDDGTCNLFNEIEPAFWFSITDRLDEGETDIALIVREGRKLGQKKADGMLYQDAPDDGNNEGALAKELRKKMPVLVMIEQTNIDEWRYPFWWPVYYTPTEMNVGIYAEARETERVEENLYSMPPRPVEIESFVVKKAFNVDDAVLEQVMEKVEEIQELYDTEFSHDDIECLDVKRKKCVCPIYYDDVDETFSVEKVTKQLESLKKKAEKILDKTKTADNLKRLILNYFESAIAGKATDSIRDEAMSVAERLKVAKYIITAIRNLIRSADDIVYRKGEVFGLFTPIAPDKFEIRIFTEEIKSWLKDNNLYSESAFEKMVYAVMAHEMYHAFHFVDVITASGKWVYTRRGYYKQIRVQEALAEYFALMASKMIIDSPDHKESERAIRRMRKIGDFPEDPYAGCLVLERAQNSYKAYGNKMGDYNEIYEASLTDMVAADKILTSL